MIVEPICFFTKTTNFLPHFCEYIYMGIKKTRCMTFGHLKEKEKKVSLNSNIQNEIEWKPLTDFKKAVHIPT